jgi:muramidase (phage lysozyme)
MNASIAAASLLGFGDKPASQAMSGFASTLQKMYATQVESHRREDMSREAAINEYNKSERDRKRRESDMMKALMGGGSGGGSQSGGGGGGRKRRKGSLLAKILLGGLAVTLAGKALFDFIKTKTFETLKETVTNMVEPILDAFGQVFTPVKNFFDSIGETVTKPFKEALIGIRQFLGMDDSDYDSDSESSGSGSSSSSTEWGPVLDMLASAESRGRYDVVYGGKIINGITEMTIEEAAREAGDRGDGKNYAVGRYQFITLVDQAKAAGLDPTKDKFSPENQDKIAVHLIEVKRKITKAMVKSDPKEAAKRLAMEWAGVPVLEATKGAKRNITRGQSYYEGDKVNTATISPEAVETSFKKLQKGGIAEGELKKLRQKHQKRKGKNGAPSEDSVLPQGMKFQKRAKGGKIFLHWAGSGYTGAHPNYHATVQGDGSVQQTRDYNQLGGRHTYLRNNQGIGISLAAMKGGSDGNFGSYPVKPQQYDGMAQLVADIAKSRGWSAADINVRNVMTHAEAASGKDGQLPGNDNYGPTAWGGDGSRWDLWMLYQNDPEGSGGGKIRNLIRAKMGGDSVNEGSGSIPRESDTSPARTTESSSPSSSMSPSLEGVLPGSPSLMPSVAPTTLEGALVQMATQLIAPMFGLASTLTGNPVPNNTGQKQISSGGAGNGAASITDPNARAILNAIADAEGTSKYAEQGYRTMFTGKQFSGTWKHPRQIQSSSGYKSDAAGRYQFLSTTWDGMGMPDFSPESQDRAALKLLSQAGVNISDGLSEQEIYKVGQKWASVEGGPSGVKGGSYGSQAKYSASQFMEMYKGYGGQPQKLQQGGTVGHQINTGGMRGSQNIQMSRLQEAHQRMKTKGGPKIIQVTLPPMPGHTPPPQQQSYSTMSKPRMTMSELSDYNRRLGIGALA